MTPDDMDDGPDDSRPYNLAGFDSWRTRAPEDEAPEPYDWHAEGKFVCKPETGCSSCWPRCPSCGRSVGRFGEFCNHCLEAVEALPDSDEGEL